MREVMLEYIKDKFLENIRLSNKKDKSLYTITIPLYLGMGDPMTISVREKTDEIILSNGMYKSLKRIFQPKIEEEFEKVIIDSKRYYSSIEKNLKSQNIENTLNLRKKVSLANSEEVASEILIYAFCVKNHYDYIYYDLIKKEKKPRQESILSSALNNYIAKFNLESRKKIMKIEDKDFLSDKNSYYTIKNILFSNVSNKVDFLDAKDDIQEILEQNEKRSKKGIILYDRLTPKYKVSDEYIEKLRKRLKKKNIMMLDIKDELDIENLTLEIEKNNEVF